MPFKLFTLVSVIVMFSSLQVHAKRRSKVTFNPIDINIYQPPVACVEEAVPSFPEDRIVEDSFGFHKDILEVFKKNNGVLNDDDEGFEGDWLLLNGARDAKSKINAVYEAAAQNHMPPQVLVGALLQESSMVDMGISEDFGNWSCGIGQINLIEWCNWAKNETPEMKKKINWPFAQIEAFEKENPGRDVCAGDFLRAAHVKPFYDNGIQKLRSDGQQHKAFMLQKHHLGDGSGVTYENASRELDWITRHQKSCARRHRFDDECLKAKLNRNEGRAQYVRYLLAQNFAANCADHRVGIKAKAYTLRQLFDQLPQDIRLSQKYNASTDQQFQRSCLQPIQTDVVPLHVGWLLSDAVYNAGQEIIPGIYKYKSMHHLSWEQMTPRQLANAVDYTLRKKMYSKQLTEIGREEAHYHIRNVIGNVTLPDENIVEPYHPPESKRKNKKKQASQQIVPTDDENIDEWKSEGNK
ncbi:MAG: hypothetical protein H7Z71_05125 [Moraxellaceae bacterium]|nr:hypothetical protein [Pseudobdellovibrionaceae bacterium]